MDDAKLSGTKIILVGPCGFFLCIVRIEVLLLMKFYYLKTHAFCLTAHIGKSRYDDLAFLLLAMVKKIVKILFFKGTKSKRFCPGKMKGEVYLCL